MHLLLLNAFIVAGLFGLANSACNVCTCQQAATATENQFDDDIANELSYEKRVFVPVTGQTVTDCQLQLVCNYGDTTSVFDPRAVVVTVGGKQSQSSNLVDVSCVNSKWMYQEEEVKYVACYKSTPIETDD